MSVNTAYDFYTSTVQKRAEEAKNGSNSSVSSFDFLTLLIAQLSNQDPLNPMDDMDFTGQLAQLQALEEQMAMTKTMAAMRQDTQVQAGTAMIGKTVSGYDASGSLVTGVVTRVIQGTDDVYVELSTGSQIAIGDIIGISGGSDSSAGGDIANAANTIGMWVEAGYDSNMQPIKGIVETVVVKSGQVYLKLYGGSYITFDQIELMRVPTEEEVFYTLPDSVREQVELGQSWMLQSVGYTNADGEEVTGIVEDVLINGHNVYLQMFDGSIVSMKDVTAEGGIPTAEEILRDLPGHWLIGLDADGNLAQGVIVGAEEREDGVVVLLSDGSEVYYEFTYQIREATEDELKNVNNSGGGNDDDDDDDIDVDGGTGGIDTGDGDNSGGDNGDGVDGPAGNNNG